MCGQTIRRYIYETRQPKHLHSSIRWYKRHPQGPASIPCYTPPPFWIPSKYCTTVIISRVPRCTCTIYTHLLLSCYFQRPYHLYNFMGTIIPSFNCQGKYYFRLSFNGHSLDTKLQLLYHTSTFMRSILLSVTDVNCHWSTYMTRNRINSNNILTRMQTFWE